MKILLDTHVFLWALLTPEKLTKKSIRLLNDPHNEKYLSAVSSWEITIKYAKGGIDLPKPPREFVIEHVIAAGILTLPINVSDTLLVGDLPPHHKDPFDRLLIAQANNNGMQIITDDKIFKIYGLKTLPA